MPTGYGMVIYLNVEDKEKAIKDETVRVNNEKVSCLKCGANIRKRA